MRTTNIYIYLHLHWQYLNFRCVAVGTHDGYHLYGINSTDSMDLVHKDGETVDSVTFDLQHNITIM